MLTANRQLKPPFTLCSSFQIIREIRIIVTAVKAIGICCHKIKID